jgi:hypothetical protein
MAQNGKTAEDELEVFDRNNFDRSANVDNKWLPLQPGTQWVYNGFTQEGKNRVPHRVVQTVTDLTKVINGVRAVVVWDVDYKDGNLEESEIVFFAQDKDSNVWLLGELVEKYDETAFVGASLARRHGWCECRNHDEGGSAAGDAQLLSGLRAGLV